MNEQDDPVKAIKLLDDIATKLVEFKKLSNGLVDENDEHPAGTVAHILYHCRNLMFQQYGKMLWYTPDGPINQPLSKDDILTMPTQVLPEVRTELGAEDNSSSATNGRPIQ